MTLPFLVIASFLLWLFAFRAFLSGDLSLVGDAIPYYEHFKYFIDQLSQGIYPLWDPTRNGGVPNEFFLRRIGSFNPFYLLIVILVKGGISFAHAYMAFLSLYYLLCMLGFYLLAKKIFQSSALAFACFVLLMFSSLSSLVFSSFLILPMTPIVWFFFFLYAFYESQKKSYFLGLTFCLMLIVTTYLPFYFATIMLFWFMLSIFIYFRETKVYIRLTLEFIQKHKLFSCLCLLCFLSSLLPGILFFLEGQEGRYVLPIRNKDLSDVNAVMVAPQTYVEGGIMATTLINDLFFNYKSFILGKVYLPLVFYAFLLCGLIAPLNKKIVFLSLLTFLAYMVGVYEASPAYQFLYEHVFWIKYMRNFQYFLWLIIVPAFVFIGIEQLKGVLKLFNIKPLKSSHLLGVLCLFLFITVIHPIYVYSFLSKNTPKRVDPYRYEQPYDFIVFHKKKSDGLTLDDMQKLRGQPAPTAWFMTRQFFDLMRSVGLNVMDAYQGHTFYLYPNDAPVKLGVDLEALSDKERQEEVYNRFLNMMREGFAVHQESDQFRVLDYKPNQVTIKTHYNRDQLLVYNDGYYKGWEVLVNGVTQNLYQANFAFKGVWLPAGENKVSFYYGRNGLLLLHQCIFVLFYTSFIFLIVLLFKERR